MILQVGFEKYDQQKQFQLMDRGEQIIYQTSEQSSNHKSEGYQHHSIEDVQKIDVQEIILNNPANSHEDISDEKLTKNVIKTDHQPGKEINPNLVPSISAENDGSSSLNAEIHGVCIAIYSSLVRDSWLLEKFIYQKVRVDDQVKLIKRNTALAEYLSKLSQKKPYQHSSLYKNAINQLQIRTKEQISKTWSMLSQSEIEQYEYIALNLKNRHNKSKQITKYHKPEMSARELFQLDIMAHFMRRNREYQQYCTKSTMKSIISKKTMEQLFCQSALYVQCWEKFADYEDWIYFDFQSDFSELITIASIVELKSRIVHNNSRFAKQKTQVEVINIERLQFLQRLLSNKEQDQRQKAFKYKFCELAFTYNGCLYSSKAHSVRSQISMKLSKISSIPSVLEQSRQFLNIKYDYFVTISSLKTEYDRLQQTASDQLVKLSKQNNLTSLSDLQNIQWRYLPTRRLPAKFQLINKGTSSQLCAFERLIMKKFCEIALKRVNLLEKVSNVQFKLQKACGRVPIFIMRYSFSYNNLVSKKSAADKDILKTQDLCSQVFISFKTNKLLAISTARQQFDSYVYGTFLRKLFKKLDQQRFFLVLYQFNSQNRIAWQVYMHLCHYFKEMFDSHVYISTNQAYFKKHLSLIQYIDRCLMANAFSAENFHEVFEEIVHRIADVLRSQAKRSLQQQKGQKSN